MNKTNDRVYDTSEPTPSFAISTLRLAANPKVFFVTFMSTVHIGMYEGVMIIHTHRNVHRYVGTKRPLLLPSILLATTMTGIPLRYCINSLYQTLRFWYVTLRVTSNTYAIKNQSEHHIFSTTRTLSHADQAIREMQT